ncbi:hypothetical protein M3685_12395 [Heyndrickxia oleronia]|uniref:Uncharacterized protein n=1 Tax=Heyndrickxia oleronia TaxID=38875 RepID=A0A8E2IB13_9BACI|nr:hypothetical protein [Heyndrickxia oleronia]OJH17066.1 hypothetical protein BLX88_20340 [Bacillus obstructivus]MCM3454722.1 hypothetical protein [Heyndrickxia oleronia]MEC1373804.1 hypothetical protein [Heyndrickxia oleronia]OOP69989.1 hypothetical protein BWZ43_02120 [Heyndrickxia oleronia]QQZ05383.1 hypothetical protein I5818_02290 [Heyndrickxia oleronia]
MGGTLKMPKFLKLIIELAFILLFAFLAIKHFSDGSTFNGIVFSGGVIVAVVLLIKEIITVTKSKKLFEKEVIMDGFLLGRLKTSLSISYLYLVIFLSVTIFTDNSLESFRDSVSFAFFSSLVVFMFAQLVQFFFNYSRE